MKKITILSLLLLLLGALTGCREDQPDQPREALLTLEVKAPIGVDGQLSDLTGEIVSKTTGKRIPLAFDGLRSTLTLYQGESYSLSISGSFATKGALATLDYREDLVMTRDPRQTHECQLTFVMPKESFVLSEIFYAGTRDRKGEQYDEDKYIRITNNSSVTRYLDGLALVRSLFQSDEKKTIDPDVRSTHFIADIVMQIPGDGTKYPVKPYESVLLCHSAINHAEHNPNSLDLSGAAFEWMSDKGYTDSETPENLKVPNLLPIFLSDPDGEGLQNWTMSTNGQHTYALVDLQGLSWEELARKYVYSYTETMLIPGMDPMPLPGAPALMLPNEWVLDAVNLSMKEDYQWLPISETLDAGYASVAPSLNDDSRYGKAVVRKPLREGSKVLKDTNNSSDDFVVREIK